MMIPAAPATCMHCQAPESQQHTLPCLPGLHHGFITRKPAEPPRNLTRDEMAASLRRINPDIADADFVYWLDACMQEQSEPRERIPW